MRKRAIFLLVFVSGACSLADQAVWFRWLRTVFGGSTQANSAVLACFMGGLGLGAHLVSARAERSKNPLALYARVELLAAALSTLSPLVLMVTEPVFVWSGGSRAVALFGTALAVFAPAVFMGATLPSACRVYLESGGERERLGLVYGANTLGAVFGAMVPAFFLIERLGLSKTFSLSVAVNIAIGLAALLMSRAAPPSSPHEPAKAAPAKVSVLVVAFTSGFVFFVVELCWYRLLTPLLGGSTYTFALILGVALCFIALGATRVRHVSLQATALFGALGIGLLLFFPRAIARFALILRDLDTLGFWGLTTGWLLVTITCVAPFSFAAGAQLPLLFRLAGQEKEGAARDVGAIYGVNTAGAIAGALVGGFVLIPLSAVTTLRVCGVLWAAIALVAITSTRRGLVALASIVLLVALLLITEGPGPYFRHSGIGVGRGPQASSPLEQAKLEADLKMRLALDDDGTEAALAIFHDGAPAAVVGGKSDGHAIADSMTQVGSALIPALLQDAPKRAFVVGLGTGQTAGWLARVPSMERVDVVELEPAMRAFADMQQQANHLPNPKVHLEIADGRAALQTKIGPYDLVISEPSNPYRAGIASFYTQEFYALAHKKLTPTGCFAQWVQGYEAPSSAIALVVTTLRSVFPHVELWSLERGDLLMIACQRAPRPHLERLAVEPYRSGFRGPLGLPATSEGLVAKKVAGPELANDLFRALPGWRNTDDRPVLEFTYARTIGDREQRALVEIVRRFVTHPTRHTIRGWTHRGLAPPFLTTSLEQDPEIKMTRAILRGDLEAAKNAARALDEDASDPSLEVRRRALLSLGPLEGLAVVDNAALGVLIGGPPEAFIAALREDPFGQPIVTARALFEVERAVDKSSALEALLEGPFAANVLEVERIEVARELADALDDPRCADLEANLNNTAPFEEDALKRRARCFSRTNDARLKDADNELTRFLRLRGERDFLGTALYDSEQLNP